MKSAEKPSEDLPTAASSAEATAATAAVPKAPGAPRASTGAEAGAEAAWQVYLGQLQRHANNGGTVSVEDAGAMGWRRTTGKTFYKRLAVDASLSTERPASPYTHC